MLLQAPAAEEVIFALPSVDAPEQAPVLCVLDWLESSSRR
jgi:hypothetical protein